MKHGWRVIDMNHYFYSKAHIDPHAGKVGDFLEGCGVDAKDSIEDRRRKYERIRAWWRESGAGYHHWWNLWSTHCRNWRSPEDPPDDGVRAR